MSLVESEKQISIDVDSNINIYQWCVRHFEDEKGEYITLKRDNPSEIYDEIVFFSLENQKEVRSVKVHCDGPNAINGRLFGYDILAEDSTVVTSMYLPILYILNNKGEIIKEVALDKTEGQTESLMLSESNQPLVLNRDIIDFPQAVPLTRNYLRPNSKQFRFQDCPLAYMINIKTDEVSKSTASFPPLYENHDKVYFIEENSRVFDGTNYVYSFFAYDSLIVTDYTSSKATPAKSRYIEEVENKGVPVGFTKEDLQKRSTKSLYGNIVYDKYRKVLYRFCYFDFDYPGPYTEEYSFCHGAFSIMIINSDYKVIGETVFPAGKYAPKIFFVNKDGLWLCENNFQREDMTDDVMMFRCLKLEEKKK